MAAVCAVTDVDSIRRYLKHINIDYDPPARSPPQNSQQQFDYGQDNSNEYEDPVIYLS